MNIIDNDNVVCFDVDDTLVMWNVPRDAEDLVVVDNFGTLETLVPNRKHIELMRQFKARGFTVVVWTQGGASWAKNVIDALKISDMVDLVMRKPTWVVDDLSPTAWLSRIYMEEKDGKAIYRFFKDLDEEPSGDTSL
jgi:phosphoserine phosphatase